MQGLGSDGESSMTDVRVDVGAYFKNEIPNLVQTHCISYQLALAGKDFSTSIAYFENIFDTLGQVAYFYDYSAIQTAGLKETQQIFDDPVFKLSHGIDTCWLSKGKHA